MSAYIAEIVVEGERTVQRGERQARERRLLRATFGPGELPLFASSSEEKAAVQERRDKVLEALGLAVAVECEKALEAALKGELPRSPEATDAESGQKEEKPRSGDSRDSRASSPSPTAAKPAASPKPSPQTPKPTAHDPALLTEKQEYRIKEELTQDPERVEPLIDAMLKRAGVKTLPQLPKDAATVLIADLLGRKK